jgi:hypothetical protein
MEAGLSDEEARQAVKCRNCGDPVDLRRVELGYDYCLKEECQRACMRLVRLASVGVNKAADYYTTADELLPPPGPPARETLDEPEDDVPVAPARRGKKAPPAAPKSTLAKLRDREHALDATLDSSYQRFRAGEITARELDAERRALIGEFNRVVTGENIRYRSMLRKP